MKNVQIIDGALNAEFAVYQFNDDQFESIFPSPDQNIEFVEDVEGRLSDEEFDKAFAGVWDRKLKKSEIRGIHGTLFYGMKKRARFYPNKKESDLFLINYKPFEWLETERDGDG